MERLADHLRRHRADRDLRRLPLDHAARFRPSKPETLDEIAGIPQAIVLASKPRANRAPFSACSLWAARPCFWSRIPFCAAFSASPLLLGISKFQFIQWIAPLVSEAPEGISAFYWARDHNRASIALMNLVSSNINQWTLLAALLPMVLSMSAGHVAAIPLDARRAAICSSPLAIAARRDVPDQYGTRVVGGAGLFVLFLVQLADSAEAYALRHVD